MNIEQEMYQKHLDMLKELIGKTIKRAIENNDGSITIVCSDTSEYEIFPHCAGGVFVSKLTA